MTEETKTCRTCAEAKPLTDYHRQAGAKDGRQRECKTCRAEWYRTNRESRALYGTEYKAANPHIHWEASYRRRAERYGMPAVIESFTRAELIDRYGDACVHCGGPFEHLDHYPVPVAHGGPHRLDNCAPSCAACNLAQSGIRRARQESPAA